MSIVLRTEPPFLSKKDSVAERLRGQILRGALGPGTRLHQDAIATALRVSPTPVREAFRVLQAEGLLEGETNHGVTVARLAPSEWIDYYEVRRMLETHALARVTRMADDVLAEMASCVRSGARSMRLRDIHPFRVSNARFHELLLESAKSRPLEEIGKSVMARSLFFIPLERSRMAGVLREHIAILKALQDESVPEAVRLLDAHLSSTIENLRKHALSQGDSRGPAAGQRSRTSRPHRVRQEHTAAAAR